jgi:hypothetical protein
VNRRILILVFLLLATAACGSNDREGAIGGAPLLTPAEAQNREGVVAVQGFLWARPGDNSFRLCEATLESFPPQCGEPAVELNGVDVTRIAGVDFSQNVFWADGIRARGQLANGVLTVDAIELNTHDPGTGLSFRILVPVELTPASSDFVALITNSSPVPVGLRFTNGQSADVTLSDVDSGSKRYQWSAGRGFDESVRELEIAPGETLRFPLPGTELDLEPGAYDLVGVFTGTPSPGTVRGRAVVR